MCTPEFRRVGETGGGWPGTFDDVAAAITTLPAAIEADSGVLADSRQIILAGHSAGGHLALWGAGYLTHGDTSRLPGVQVVGVLSLAGVCDLADSYALA